MKKIVLFFYLLLALFPGKRCEAQVVFKNEQVTATQLKKDVIIFDTHDHSSMYLIIGSQRSALIDTGTKVDGLDKIIRQLTNKPVDVILTHFHADHAGSAMEFSDVWIGKEDIPLLAENIRNSSTHIHAVKDGQVFNLGNKELQILSTPGHTPGSLTVLDPQDHCCYSGDSFGSGEVWLQCKPIQPIESFYTSCQKILKMMDKNKISDIWCGHHFYASFWSKGKPIDRSYIETMSELAKKIMNHDLMSSTEYPHPSPMIDHSTVRVLSHENCMIVYDKNIYK